MTRSLALAFFILSAFMFASAQESVPAAHAASIAGTVVKEPGSQPLKKVLVQVIAESLDPEVEHTLEIEPLFSEGAGQELRLESICVSGGTAKVRKGP